MSEPGGVLLSRLIRIQPVGAVIDASADKRASTEAMSTSPATTPTGRGTLSVDPETVAVAMAPPEGRTLEARPDPVVSMPMTTESAGTIR